MRGKKHLFSVTSLIPLSLSIFWVLVIIPVFLAVEDSLICDFLTHWLTFRTLQSCHRHMSRFLVDNKTEDTFHDQQEDEDKDKDNKRQR